MTPVTSPFYTRYPKYNYVMWRTLQKVFLTKTLHKMNYSVLYSLLIIACLIPICRSSLPTNSRAYGHHDHGLIGQICNETKQDQMINCTNILRADPRILSAKKIVEFSKAVLELALNKAKDKTFLRDWWRQKIFSSHWWMCKL